MIDVSSLWDFDDPAGSELRFREAVEAADPPDRDVLLTQLARSLGLQQRYDEGHAVLDDVRSADPEVAVRVALERGRLLRSAGETESAAPYFLKAVGLAQEAGLETLHVDALHMHALVAPAQDQVALTEHALGVARGSSEQTARDWDASLLNNLGMVHADAGDFTTALNCFTEALEARERIGEDGRTRVARWMVGWALRNLGRREEALAMQLALRAELVAAGEDDPYVEEEIALLTAELS